MIRFLFLALLCTSAFSHPHTFIDVYPSIKKEAPKLINFKWKFDDMTSSILIMELDSNMDGKIDAAENKFIEREYFPLFIPYSYYTFIVVNGKKQKTKPKNFQASIEGDKLCYAFDIELDAELKDIYFEFGDPDLYNALVLKKEFIDAQGIKTKVSGVDKEFYYGYRLEFE
jgi:ABC-type uncharacterized transport system substrate-binding protein